MNKKNSSFFTCFKLVLLIFLATPNYSLGATNCIEVIDSIHLDQLTQKIKTNDFDETKIKIIKSSLDKNCFNSIQLKGLLSLLSFEEDKINIIKLAYKKLVDPENIETVLAVLEFDSSKKEINDFIANSK